MSSILVRDHVSADSAVSRPAWVRIVALLPDVLPSLLSVLGVVWLLLIDLGSFHSWLIYPLAVLAAVGTFVGVARLSARCPGSPVAVCWDVMALALTGAFAIVNGRYASQHLLVDRDPAIYATTAQYLVHHDSFPVHVDPSVYASGVSYPAGGYYALPGSGDLSAQGMHGVPAVLAAVGRVFGSGALLRTDAVIGALGVLAVYALARRLAGGAWALTAALVMAVSLPEIHFSRDVYSEPMSQAALFAGLALFVLAYRGRGGPWAYAFAGLVFAGSATTRTDAFLTLTGPLVLAVLLLVKAPVGARSPARARAGGLLCGLALPTVIGFYDLRSLSPAYYAALSSDRTVIVAALGATLVSGAVVVAVAWSKPPILAWAHRQARSIAFAASGLLAVLFALLALRPLFGPHRAFYNDQTVAFVSFLQRGTGLPLDPNRDYAERALYWPTYYFGAPTVFIGCAGICFLLYRSIARGRPEVAVLLATLLPSMLGYLIRPTISPDQIWAVRRLLPLVIPALVVGAVTVGSEVWVRCRQARGGSIARSFGIVGLVGFTAQAIIVPSVATAHLFGEREYVPTLDAVREFCSDIGPTAVVLGVDELAAQMSPAITSFCRVPSATLLNPTREQLATQQSVAASRGRTLWIYGDTAEALRPYLSAGSGPPTAAITLTSSAWSQLLTGAPTDTTRFVREIYVARVVSGGGVEPLPGGGS